MATVLTDPPTLPSLRLRLDSSEDYPSDHTSLYNATLAAGGWRNSKASEPTGTFNVRASDNTLSDGPTPGPPASRLATIEEKGSKLGLELQSEPRQVGGMKNGQASAQAGIHRRMCFSVDERRLMDLHAQLSSQRDSGIEQHGREDQAAVHRQLPLPRPMDPPFPAPTRIPTPEGVPSWPGPTPLPRYMQQTYPPKRPSALRSKLTKFIIRHPKSHRTAFLRKCGFRPAPPRPSSWRHPMSGHTTFRYADVEAHPFNFASDNGRVDSGKTGRNLAASSREGWQSALHSPGRTVNNNSAALPASQTPEVVEPKGSSAIPARTSSGTRTTSDTNPRDLAAASNLPIVPSPAAVEAVARRRSASLPSASCRSTFKAGHKRRSTFPSDTVTTFELLDAFPFPPGSTEECLASPPSSHPRGKLTLFPRSSDENCPPRPRKESLDQHDHDQNREASGHGDDPMEPLASGALRRSDSAVCLAARVRPASSVRGEDTTHYRHSGIPVYTPEAASLHSLDRAEDEAREDDPEHSPSAQSGRTGGSRHFSATSRALPSRAHTATPAAGPSLAPAPSQRDRAVANGALRFSASRSPLPPPATAEYMVPITLTGHGKKGPRNRKVVGGKLQGKKSLGAAGFDGAADDKEKKGDRKSGVKGKIRRKLQKMFGMGGCQHGGGGMLR